MDAFELYFNSAYLVILHAFCHLIFSKSTFSKNSFKNTIRVLKSLDPDQARHYVGPDLGPNCLQRSSADDTSRQRVKYCSELRCPNMLGIYGRVYMSQHKLLVLITSACSQDSDKLVHLCSLPSTLAALTHIVGT